MPQEITDAATTVHAASIARHNQAGWPVMDGHSLFIRDYGHKSTFETRRLAGIFECRGCQFLSDGVADRAIYSLRDFLIQRDFRVSKILDVDPVERSKLQSWISKYRRPMRQVFLSSSVQLKKMVCPRLQLGT